MDILPANRRDWDKTPLPEGRYSVKITSYGFDHSGAPRMYFDVVSGEYTGVYDGIACFFNSFSLNNYDCSMLSIRLNAISSSNDDFDAVGAYEHDDWDAFVGKVCDVTFKKKYRDLENGHYYTEPDVDGKYIPCTVQNAVLEYSGGAYDNDKQTAKRQANIPAPINGKNTIYVDNRQHEGKHDEKHQALLEAGYKLKSAALSVGDYMMDGSNVTIDTKRNLDEFAHNLDTTDSSRFMAEVRRAHDNRLQLVFLITEPGIKSATDIEEWIPAECQSCKMCNPHYAQTCEKGRDVPLCGMRLRMAIETLAYGKYPAHVMFVEDEIQAAEVIVKLLTRNS